jgi:hypothetical protein
VLPSFARFAGGVERHRYYRLVRASEADPPSVWCMKEIRVPGDDAPRAAIPFGVNLGLYVHDISVEPTGHLGQFINCGRSNQDAQLQIRLVELEEGPQRRAAAAVGPDPRS